MCISTKEYRDDDTLFGEIKWYDANQGFGFVWIDGFDADVFVHHTEVRCDENELSDGVAVSCHVAEGRKGLLAKNLTLENAQ